MHFCTTCDELCSCNADGTQVVGDPPIGGCSHCALCCVHGYRIDGPCDYCETDGFNVDEDAPPPTPGSAT